MSDLTPEEEKILGEAPADTTLVPEDDEDTPSGGGEGDAE